MSVMRSLALVGLCLAVPFAQPLSAAGVPLATTIDDQEAVAITVYNDNMGLVREERTVALAEGGNTLSWRDVASGIITQSVALSDTASDSAPWRVLEQNYRYDLVSREKLIQKYLGQAVQIEMKDPLTGLSTVKPAKLLSPDVIEIGGKIYPGIPGQLILPELPGGLISVPALEWELESAAGGDRTIALSYLTKGISWWADYVAVVNEDDTALDLSGWTTIANSSGAAYHDARLKLVAGNVNRVEDWNQNPTGHVRERQPGGGGGLSTEGFGEKAFFEYHLYTLGRPATLLNNEQKQIALFDPAHTPAVKRYVFGSTGDYYSAGESQKIEIAVKLEFENRKERGLGMPLPGGTVRVYKQDTDGSLQFVGEDRIEHTPKDETVRLMLGTAFDIAGERVRTDRRKISDKIYESDITVKLRNHKTETVTVTVRDRVSYGVWSITKSSGGTYSKPDASTLEFDVRCPPDVETVLTYTIRREY